MSTHSDFGMRNADFRFKKMKPSFFSIRIPKSEIRNQKVSSAFFIARVLACMLFCSFSVVAVMAQSSITHIVGIVQDQAHAPIAQAEVLIKNQSITIAQATTDSDGRFKIDGVVTAYTALTVHAQGFALFERRFDEISTSPQELVIVLAPATLSEQVTVTATRTETRLGDVAASISTLSSTDLSMTAATTLDDALRQVAGFSLFRRSGSRTANPTSQGVSLRGVGASGASRAP